MGPSRATRFLIPAHSNLLTLKTLLLRLLLVTSRAVERRPFVALRHFVVSRHSSNASRRGRLHLNHRFATDYCAQLVPERLASELRKAVRAHSKGETCFGS